MKYTFLEKITHLGVFKYLEKKRFIQYALDFEQTLRQLEEYLHISDDQEEIINGTLETACEFYQGDWCGFIEVDMDLGLWTTTEWFNKSPDDKTKDFLNEFESSDVWQRWIEAIKENHPLIIEDVEVIKGKYPDEYDAYKRLSVDSLIAVPFRPRPLGVVVIRNPKRYIRRSSMLQMLAFVALTAVNEKKLFERARMAWSPDDIKCDNDIIINLFGELEIYTSHGVMREVDIKSPKASKLLVYLLMNRGKTIPPRTIVEEVWPDEVDDSDNIGRNIKNLVCRFRKNFKVLSDEDLIVSMPTGYCINPKLNIMTDLQLFDKYFRMAHETTSIATKIEFLVKGMDVYKGKLLPEAAHELWMVSTAVHYHYHYTGMVNELLKLLMERKEYLMANKYAMRSLRIAPDNGDAYYWLIQALCHLGMSEVAKSELKIAEKNLLIEDYENLIENLKECQGLLEKIQMSDVNDLTINPM